MFFYEVAAFVKLARSVALGMTLLRVAVFLRCASLTGWRPLGCRVAILLSALVMAEVRPGAVRGSVQGGRCHLVVDFALSRRAQNTSQSPGAGEWANRRSPSGIAGVQAGGSAADESGW